MPRLIVFIVLVLSLSSAKQVRSQGRSAPNAPRQWRGCLLGPSYLPLRQEVAQARFVLDGTLANPAMNPAGDLKNAVTDLHILTVVKTDPALKDDKVITLSRHLDVPDPKKPPRVLIFFDIHKGKLDPYRGIAITSDALPKYLVGALKLDPKKPGDAVLFFQRHLDSPSPEVVRDAHYELSAITSEEIRRHAARLPAETIAARLKNRNTPLWLLDLDCKLLGHCGNERHTDFLEKLIEVSRKREPSTGLEGALIGYTLLRPKEGLAKIRDIVSQPALPFMLRYQALKALRFFGQERTDVLSRRQVVDAMGLMLSQPDIADLPIEEMRRLGEESVLDRVLALYGKKEFDVPIVHRAILRYALTFPKNPKAVRFVEQRRAEDPEMVGDAEELLKLEKMPGARR